MTEVLGDVRAELGESPVWDGQLLHWVDLWGGAVHSTDPLTGATTSVAVEAPVSVVLPTCGGLMIGRAGEFRVLGGDVVAEGLAPDGMRLNEAVADHDGRIWFGTMGWTAADDRPGVLGVLEDGRATTVLEGVGLANGLGLSPDGSRLWFADTRRGTVTAYPLHGPTLGPGQVVIDVPAPDGLCVDEDGCVWVAVFGGGELRRFTPDGRFDRRVPLPVAHPTNCAFLDDQLVVTSARRDSSPLAGALLLVPVGVRGAPVATALEGALR